MMATKAAAKQEVAVQKTGAMTFSEQAPAYISQTAARGSEEVKSSDMVLPRLEIVQGLSPIKESVEGADEGFMYNSVTQEVYGDLVYFVPVYFKLEYLIWKDQDEGGGFFGSFSSEHDAKERRADVIAGGEADEFIEIVDTPVQYGLRITPEGVCEQIVISMAKSKSKVSRKWNAMIQLAGGDRFSRVYKLTTFTDENKKGKKFKNFVVQPAGFAPEPVYRQAEKLYEALKTQAYSVAHDSVIDNEAEQQGEVDRKGI